MRHGLSVWKSDPIANVGVAVGGGVGVTVGVGLEVIEMDGVADGVNVGVVVSNGGVGVGVDD
jgi:hypothetical protein